MALDRIFALTTPSLVTLSGVGQMKNSYILCISNKYYTAFISQVFRPLICGLSMVK